MREKRQSGVDKIIKVRRQYVRLIVSTSNLYILICDLHYTLHTFLYVRVVQYAKIVDCNFMVDKLANLQKTTRSVPEIILYHLGHRESINNTGSLAQLVRASC